VDIVTQQLYVRMSEEDWKALLRRELAWQAKDANDRRCEVK
jgi:hypothetical protein